MHEVSSPEFSVSAIRERHASSSVSLNVVPVLLHHEDTNFEPVTVYALLDACSQGTFVEEGILGPLLSKARDASVSLKTVNGDSHVNTKAISGLRVSCLHNVSERYGPTTISLPTAYTQEHMPFGATEVATASNTSSWKYLHRISEFLPVLDPSIPFSLIIGSNCSKALEPYEVIRSRDSGPFAIRTKLGWCVSGRLSNKLTSPIGCHFVKAQAPYSESQNHPGFVGDVKDESIGRALEFMYNQEFVERNSEETGRSVDDDRFLKDYVRWR